MKRKPTQSRSQNTVASVIEAATRILREKEWKDISVAKLSEKAGVGVASVYDYFKSKDSVIDELLKQTITKNLFKIRNVLLEKYSTNQEAIDRLVKTIDEIYLKEDRSLQIRVFKMAAFLGMTDGLFAAREQVIGWMKVFVLGLPDQEAVSGQDVERLARLITHAGAGLLQGGVKRDDIQYFLNLMLLRHIES